MYSTHDNESWSTSNFVPLYMLLHVCLSACCVLSIVHVALCTEHCACCACVSLAYHRGIQHISAIDLLVFMSVTQALFDPLQGFGNAVLFVLLSRVLLYRLYISFTRPFVRLWHCFTLCCQGKCSSTSYSNNSIEPNRTASIQSATSEKGVLKVKYSPTQKKRITIEKKNLEEDDLSDKHYKLAYGSMEQHTPLLASNQNTLQ